MSIARLGGETYTFALAETNAEQRAIHELREAEYSVSQPYLRATDVYDERSFIFGCWSARGGPPVGTCRFTTALAGRYELDDLAPSWVRPPIPCAQLLETSRVVVARGHRATGLVEVMLLLAGSWLLASTSYRFNFAVCARPLVRLYARLGMQPADLQEIALRGRPTDKRYIVIYGDMASAQAPTVTRVERNGWRIYLDDSKREVGT